MTDPRIEILPETKLVGKRLSMSLANNRTVELWRSFMPHRQAIKNTVSTDLYSMQVYPSVFDFNPQTVFEKWAARKVSQFDQIPDAMEPYVLTGGLYAVFIHVGLPSDFEKTFRFIFNQWLPHSTYELDDREHFELLGSKYKNNEPDSEEEIWIPIHRKLS